MSGSAPPAPDYVGAAKATADSSAAVNTQQTWANRPTQTSPWGSVTWNAGQTLDPSTGQPVTTWAQNTALNPQLQSALDDQLNIQSGRSDIANTMLDRAKTEFAPAVDWGAFPANGAPVAATNTTPGATPSGTNLTPTGAAATRYTTTGQPISATTTNAPGALPTADAERSRAEQAAYASQVGALDKRFGHQQTDMQTQLANKGITEGSDAYSRAQNDFGDTKNAAYSQAMLQAINAGGTEASRNFAMDSQGQAQQFGQTLQANQQNFGQQATASQQNFGQDLSANNQNFSQDLASREQGFGQNKDASSQNFATALAANQQGYQQQSGANSQNFAQQMASSSYQSTQRQQAIAEVLQQRGFSLNEINGLLNGQQVATPSMPSFNGAGKATGADFSGAASSTGQAQNAAFSAEQARNGQYTQAASTAAAAYLSYLALA